MTTAALVTLACLQFFFLSHELMCSGTATSLAIDAITRLSEFSVNKISDITDASFFTLFETWNLFFCDIVKTVVL